MNGPESINPASVQGTGSMLMQLISQVSDFQKSANDFQTMALAKFAALETRQEQFEKSLAELRAAILPSQRPPSPFIDIMTVDSPTIPAPKQEVVIVQAEAKEHRAHERSERKAKARRIEQEKMDDGVIITSTAPHVISLITKVQFPKLKNFGNTCHINSAVNLVFQLPSLVKLLKNEENHNAIKLALHELYKVFSSGDEKLIGTKLEDFSRILILNSKELQLQNGQKDADVALRYILDALKYVVPYREAKYAWQGNRNRFVYRFEDRAETVFAVQMTAKTLDELFSNSFFSTYENKDENMKWSPSSHDTPILDWKRRTFFDKAPEVLFINYLRGAAAGKKILDDLPFEKEFSLRIHLENTPAQMAKGKEKIEENGKAKYRLAGVIMHLGMNMLGGHFCNYLPKDGLWYRISDDASELLKHLEDNSARKNEVSYILAYEKVAV